jgi:four helix bundle protein
MTDTEDSSEFPKRIRSHRDLIVWRKGIDLAVETYRLARSLPAQERFVLKEQMFRASVSIPSNIAEGHGRMSKGDFVRFLRIARGSLYELETHYELCKRLGYVDDTARSKARLLSDKIWPNVVDADGEARPTSMAVVI